MARRLGIALALWVMMCVIAAPGHARDVLVGASTSYTREAQSVLSAPAVTSITPNTSRNTGSVSVTDLSGAYFQTDATVKLTKAGQPDIVATGVTVVSSTKITCSFSFTVAGTGPWNVVVTNPDAQSGALANGFTVTNSTVVYKVYWTEAGSGKIMRCNPDGTNVETVISGLNSPMGLVIDVPSQRMYWITYGDYYLDTASLDGTYQNWCYSGGFAGGIAYDPATGKIYWSEDSRIRRGTSYWDLATTVVSGLIFSLGIAIDQPRSKLYWTTGSTSVKIRRGNLDGTSAQDVVSGTDRAGISIDPVGQKLYYDSSTTMKVMRANLDGTSPQNFLTSINVQMHAPSAGTDSFFMTGDNKVRRCRLSNGGDLTTLYTGSSSTNTFGIALAEADVNAPPTRPEVSWLPAYTAGTSRSIGWYAIVGADQYYAEWDTDSLFATPDGNSGWIANAYFTATSLVDGQKYYYRVKARNAAGEGDWSSVVYSTQDASPPTGSVVINSGDTYSRSRSMTAAYSATDASSGVTHRRLSADGITWGLWSAYTSSSALSPIVGDGPWTLYVQYKDAVEHISQTYSDSIIIDTTPPTAPGTPTDEGAFTPNTAVTFTWTGSTDVTSGLAGYNCRIGTTPGGSDVFDGSVGLDTTKTITGTNGVTYYCRVQAVDNAGNTKWSSDSDGIMVSADPPAESASEAKSLGDGSTVILEGMTVTAVFGDSFYVEDISRACGIRVDKSGHGLTIGVKADITGALRTDLSGERYIEANTVGSNGAGAIRPVWLHGLSLGGCGYLYNEGSGAGQAGITGAFGLNNIGLLISIAGKVTYSDAGFFYMDDGTAVADDSGHAGVRVLGAAPVNEGEDPVGRYVRITGISSCFKAADPGTGLYRQIRAVDVQLIE